MQCTAFKNDITNKNIDVIAIIDIMKTKLTKL